MKICPKHLFDRNNTHYTAERVFGVVLAVIFLLSSTPTTLALPASKNGNNPLKDNQQLRYKNGILFVDDNSSCATGGTDTVSGASAGVTIGRFDINQVKTFAGEPITSTWNISNGAAEQWFLKQAGAQATIAKYGLTSSNIGQITSAVGAANVSAVFFYLYTVNEGGGAGGFINHYGSDIPGGGPANATRDAQYLADQSKTKGSPATGGGEPADLPTAEAQQILDALPSGSIGVVYIPATSAVTAELEYLSGKTGDWNPGDSASPATRFGSPLEQTMKNIKTMGGDPSQGGSTTSTTSCSSTGDAVTGEGIAKAVSWAVSIANNNGYGYDQSTRTSGWGKWTSDKGCSHDCGSFDCSSLVSAALTEAGYFDTNPNFATGTEGAELEKVGFKNVMSSVNVTTGENLEPGDILVNTVQHTAIYMGNNKMVAARINENGGVSGGQTGDQTGEEIMVETYSNHPWDSVYRATK
jgi:hypothetical protein